MCGFWSNGDRVQLYIQTPGNELPDILTEMRNQSLEYYKDISKLICHLTVAVNQLVNASCLWMVSCACPTASCMSWHEEQSDLHSLLTFKYCS